MGPLVIISKIFTPLKPEYSFFCMFLLVSHGWARQNNLINTGGGLSYSFPMMMASKLFSGQSWPQGKRPQVEMVSTSRCNLSS